MSLYGCSWFFVRRSLGESSFGSVGDEWEDASVAEAEKDVGKFSARELELLHAVTPHNSAGAVGMGVEPFLQFDLLAEDGFLRELNGFNGNGHFS